MSTTTPLHASEMRNDRQETILKAAELLFAEHGFHAVTLRQIADAARVPLALVGYYFGRKQDLYRTIFTYRRHLHLDRLELLDNVRRQHDRSDSLPRIVEAFALPLLQLRHQGETRAYARLLAREILLGSPAGVHALTEGFDALMQRFIDALRSARPEAGEADLAWGGQFTLGALALHLRDDRIERQTQGRLRASDPAAAERLMRYLTGGLQQTLLDPKAGLAAPRRVR